MSDEDFVRRCLELHAEGVPFVAARFHLFTEGAGSYIEIEQRLRRLDPFQTGDARGSEPCPGT